MSDPALPLALPRVALLVLCHEPPAQVARRLASPFFQQPGIAVYLHYDAARGDARLDELKSLLPPGLDVRFVADRVRCHWGDHTLVEATRRLLALALADTGFAADHLVLVSGSCVPYRPAGSLRRFLAEHPGTEFIQAHDISQGRWIKDGLERERHEYYFPFNFRTQRARFEWLTARQREFGIRRTVPGGLKVHFGSQWFCLTRATAARVAERLAEPAIRRWLRWSWIPDEFVIQTLVADTCPPARIAGHSLTYYEFDGQGQPLVLDNGHLDHLLAQPFFFARKLAPEARALEAALDAHVARDEADTGYFARVGRATSAYARFQAEVACGSAPQAHVGTPRHAWQGPMGTNRRRYYVLHAVSRSWLHALVQAARQGNGLPIFERPFEPRSPPVPEGDGRLGVRAADAARRDHDPPSFLFELVNAHPDQPCAFGLDICRPGAVRDLVRSDAPAVLIDCNPPLTREQRAATLLDELVLADDAPVIQGVLGAMRSGGPLPDEAFLGRTPAPACQAVVLRELGPALGDQTLLALRNAVLALDPAAHHAEAGAAWRRFWK